MLPSASRVGRHFGVDESTVRRHAQHRHAVQHLLVHLLVHLDPVALHERLGGVVIALRLDALHFPQQFAKQLAQTVVVLDVDVGLAVANHLDHSSFWLRLSQSTSCSPKHGCACAPLRCRHPTPNAAAGSTCRCASSCRTRRAPRPGSSSSPSSTIFSSSKKYKATKSARPSSRVELYSAMVSLGVPTPGSS